MNRRILIFVVVAAALVAAVLLLPVKAWLAAALQWTAAHREIAGITFVALYIVATVCFLPGVVLTFAAGAIFGVVSGVALVSLGSTLGATAAFFVGRTLARDWISRRIAAWPKFNALNAALGARGFWIVLLTRLSPAFPFFLLNYAYGVSAVRPRDYIAGSWLGMLPATVAYVYAGSVAASLGEVLSGKLRLGASGSWLLSLGLIATIAVTVLITRVAKRFLDREIDVTRTAKVP